MPPVRALCPLVLAVTAALAAGCGSSNAQLDGFRAPEAYLPPIAPEAAPAAAAPASATARSANAPATATADDTAKAPATTAPEATANDAATPPAGAAGAQAAGAPSDAEIAAELEQAFEGGAGDGDDVDAATVGGDGLATVPLTAPPKVRAMIVAANQVARKPYVYGGGHGGGPEGLFTDSAYDCSGSVSYALASAGFIDSPMASGGLAGFGKPGPGKWVSIYANAGHAFMVVAGLRFDTSGRAERDTRWQAAGRGTGGFTVRHPPGL